MGTYIAIFMFEALSFCLSLFILKKILKKVKFYQIVLICFIMSLAIGYIASYRIVGYDITMMHLTKFNNQKIELTGKGISLDEENEYKKELFRRQEFKKDLMTNSVRILMFPSILFTLIIIFYYRKKYVKTL